jgi:Domain of unknown function (DUF4397)
MSPRSRLARAAALAGAVAAATGCGDGKGVTTVPSTANVRVVHASPDAGAVDVLVDGRSLQTNLQYEQTLDYTPVSSGDHVVAVRAAGTSTDLVTVPVTLGDRASYTVVARGLASATGGNFPLVADLLTDDAAPGAGRASLRFVHAAPGAVAVDIYLTAPTVGLGGATPAVSALAYVRGGSYANEVVAGSYRLRVTQAGTTDVLLDLPSFVLSPGQAYTAVLVGAPTLSRPLALLALTDRVAPR